jgi:hypothetical protein
MALNREDVQVNRTLLCSYALLLNTAVSDLLESLSLYQTKILAFRVFLHLKLPYTPKYFE